MHLTTVLMMNFHKVRDYIYNLCTNTYTLYTIHLCTIANVFNYLYFHLLPFFCLLSLCISYSLSPPLPLSPFLSISLSSYTESVLSVAHYVSISPICINNNTDYVSASLIANNPTDYVLTRLQQFYYQRREQCPVSLVVSIGTGVYAHNKMGAFPRISSLKFRSRSAYHRLQNFIVLLRNSVSYEDYTLYTIRDMYCMYLLL